MFLWSAFGRMTCLPRCKNLSGEIGCFTRSLSHVHVLIDFISEKQPVVCCICCAAGTHSRGCEARESQHMAHLIIVEHLVVCLPADSLGLVDPADLLHVLPGFARRFQTSSLCWVHPAGFISVICAHLSPRFFFHVVPLKSRQLGPSSCEGQLFKN